MIKKFIPLLIFILVEIVLSIFVLFIETPILNILSYLVIVFAFVFSLFTLFENYNYLITIGLFFTLIADFFLVVLGNEDLRAYGMFFFMFTQLSYGIYLIFNDRKHIVPSLIIRGAINILTIIIGLIVLKEKVDPLSIFSIIYFANLISNIVVCFLNIKKLHFFLIALLLFLLCDLFVGFTTANGIYFTYEEGTFLYYLVNANFNFAWLFYIPSQTLIAITTFKVVLK